MVLCLHQANLEPATEKLDCPWNKCGGSLFSELTLFFVLHLPTKLLSGYSDVSLQLFIAFGEQVYSPHVHILSHIKDRLELQSVF